MIHETREALKQIAEATATGRAKVEGLQYISDNNDINDGLRKLLQLIATKGGWNLTVDKHTQSLTTWTNEDGRLLIHVEHMVPGLGILTEILWNEKTIWDIEDYNGKLAMLSVISHSGQIRLLRDATDEVEGFFDRHSGRTFS